MGITKEDDDVVFSFVDRQASGSTQAQSSFCTRRSTRNLFPRRKSPPRRKRRRKR